ncbi:AmmeMemoRadiSam system radical SAM enzyme [Geovibrio thiophilus]|uniref:AmmeMemoRadiSam system radical SAM enzyme n=1 Tax=Geovibrio thiophilus TaxID=139438 RepID=UPI001F4FCE5C|nr:AmmeMemoRadiSam system radical SAM enzyme [Geovibrio thiophilus]
MINNGKHGICLIRKNINGKLFQTAYGEISALALDPIEKKPLYHFHPGSSVLSIGTNGCNFRCDFCQNWHISTAETPRQKTTAAELLKMAEQSESIGIAFTYNEPTIWYEFVSDCAADFKKQGLKNVIVSNGYINKEPLRELIPLIDAANIDLKGFTEGFYKETLGSLEPVKNTIRTLYESGVSVEVTNLIIPTKNDDEETFLSMCGWLASVSPDIPLHLSAYFPAYKSAILPTEPETVIKMKEIAEKHLNYVYAGNLRHEKNDSLCPHCKAVLVKRNGYEVKSYLKTNRCPECGKQLYFCV